MFNKVYPNSWGSLNEQKVIVTEEDVAALKKEATNTMLNTKLVSSHDLNYRKRD